MADSLNPYAPPAACLDMSGDVDCWRDGRQVVLRRGTDLPHRCLRCNEPGTPPARASRFYWHTPWLYLLVPLYVVVYVVVALLARRMVKLHPVLCDAHRAEQRRYQVLVVVLVLCGAGLVLNALDPAPGLPLLRQALGVAPLLFITAIAVGAWKLRSLTPTRIDRDVVRLRGAGPAFLASLPDYPGLTLGRR